MKTLAVFDRKDYEQSLPRIVRSAARAIIVKDRKIVLLYQQASGIYLFPGGGIEEGETEIDALIREVKEETGMIVKPNTVKEYGMVVEVKKDLFKTDSVYEMRDHYYTCEIDDITLEQQLTDDEKEKGYQLVFITCDEAISANVDSMRRKNVTWSETETFVLKCINESESFLEVKEYHRIGYRKDFH